VAVALIMGLTVFAGFRFYRNQLAKYTSETALELPSAEITEEEVQAVVARLEDFRDQFDKGEAPQELVITLEEINALIANNPDLRGKVYVTIVDGDLKADVSFPLDEIPGGKGRFFNGSATLHVELDNGVLVAHVVTAEANGEAIPDMFMKEFREQNIAKELYKDVEMARTLKRCEQLIIESDRIILKVRPLDEMPAEQPDANEQPDAKQSDADEQTDAEQIDAEQTDAEQTDAGVEAEVESDAQTAPVGGSIE